MLPGESHRICMIDAKCPGPNLYYTDYADAAQNLKTAGSDLDYLDRELRDLSHTSSK